MVAIGTGADIYTGLQPEVQPFDREISIPNVRQRYDAMRQAYEDRRLGYGNGLAESLHNLHCAVIPGKQFLNLDPSLFTPRQINSFMQLSAALINNYGIGDRENDQTIRQAYNAFASAFPEGRVPHFKEFSQLYLTKVMSQSHTLKWNDRLQVYDCESRPLQESISGPRSNPQLHSARHEAQLMEPSMKRQMGQIVIPEGKMNEDFVRWWDRIPASTEYATIPDIPDIERSPEFEEAERLHHEAEGIVSEALRWRENYTKTSSVRIEEKFQEGVTFGMKMLQGTLEHTDEVRNAFNVFDDLISRENLSLVEHTPDTMLQYPPFSLAYAEKLEAFLRQSRSKLRYSAVDRAWKDVVKACVEELDHPDEMRRGALKKRTTQNLGQEIGRVVLGDAFGQWHPNDEQQNVFYRANYNILWEELSGENESALLQILGVIELTNEQHQEILSLNWRYSTRYFEAVRQMYDYNYNNDQVRRGDPIVNEAAFVATVNSLTPGEGRRYLEHLQEYMDRLSANDFSWEKPLPEFQPSDRAMQEAATLLKEDIGRIQSNIERLKMMYLLDSSASTEIVRYRLLWDLANPKIAEALEEHVTRHYNEDEQITQQYARVATEIMRQISGENSLIRPERIKLARAKISPDTQGDRKAIEEVRWLINLVTKSPQDVAQFIEQHEELSAIDTLSETSDQAREALFHDIVVMYPVNANVKTGTGSQVPLVIVPPWVDSNIAKILNTPFGPTQRPIVRCITINEIEILPTMTSAMFEDMWKGLEGVAIAMSDDSTETNMLAMSNGIPRGRKRSERIQALDSVLDTPDIFDALVMQAIEEATLSDKKKKRDEWKILRIKRQIEEFHRDSGNAGKYFFHELERRIRDKKLDLHATDKELWSLVPPYLQRYLEKSVKKEKKKK